MSISHKLCISLGVICAVLVGADIYALGRYRAATSAGAEYKRQLAETKRQLRELSFQYDERLARIEDNNRRAKSIVESMGTGLQRNDGTIQGTISLVRQLRSKIEDLQNLYSNQFDSGTSDRSNNNVEDM